MYMPKMSKTKEARQSLAEGEEVGPDELSIELLKLYLDYDTGLSIYYDSIVNM